MKYIYNIRLTDTEAHMLNIRLKEPVENRYPLSTDWEIFINASQRIFIVPAIFLNTTKFQWKMHPTFEWKASLIFSRPLNPEDKFDIVMRAPLFPAERTKYYCLALNDLSENEYPLKWSPQTKDIRSERKR